MSDSIIGGGSPIPAYVDAGTNALRVSNYPPGYAFYGAASNAPFAAAAGTLPFFVLEGSATKTIRIWRVTVTCPTLTAVAYHAINFDKYSTAASGGTATPMPLAPYDSQSAAATANLCQYYTAGPTAGSRIGTFGSRRLLSQATTAAAAGSPVAEVVFNFDGRLTLRGVAEGVGLYFAGAPASAVTLAIDVLISEE